MVAGVRSLAIDKTGTLTHGVFELAHLELLREDTFPRKKVLAYADVC